ncbi:hypothetical protein [Streptomyces sp. NPDC002133]|uniref:hypothetical protein n=1 Tax=Streptomyces sp. NPDC002133 TaxID=3154409 RepID=UPI0033327C88
MLGAPLVRLQRHEGVDASQTPYDGDFSRQLPHPRAAEAAGSTDAARLEGGLYDRRFPVLFERRLLPAPQTQPSALLVDQVDRVDEEFEGSASR